MKTRLSILMSVVMSGFCWINTVNADGRYSDTIVHVDDASFKNKSVYCEENLVEPEKNSFEILDYNVMSSEAGDRYSLMTIKNTSSGQRFLTEKHLVAIHANCFSQNPVTFKKKLSGGEVVTKNIYFGKNQFPIIKIVSGY